MKNISIIEFPSNLGLKEPSPGHEPGVKKLPGWLKNHGFHEKINPANVYRLDPPAYTMNLDKETGVRNADAIVQYAKEQAAILEKILLKKEFPLVLGGDCSILIGNALALKKKGNYGLFFLDGHTDFMWPELSQTGGAAGMDLALATGRGPKKLTNINGLIPYINQENVWCVGNREYTDWYVKAIMDSGIHYADLALLRQKGIEECVNGFLTMVHSNNLEGFWIHIDVDVLNDDIMPAVDSRGPDGLWYEEFILILELLLKDEKATGIEITILDPELDPSGQYTKEFITFFCGSFNRARKNFYQPFPK